MIDKDSMDEISMLLMQVEIDEALSPVEDMEDLVDAVKHAYKCWPPGHLMFDYLPGVIGFILMISWDDIDDIPALVEYAYRQAGLGNHPHISDSIRAFMEFENAS